MKKIIRSCQLSVLLLLFLSAGIGHSQCSASFTYSQPSNGNGLIYFTSTATTAAGSYTAFSWNFGSGVVSNTFITTPMTFTSNGAYTVTLSPQGSTCVTTSTQVIVVSSVGCSMTTSVIPTYSNNGLVNFSTASTGTTGSTTYTLNYGDGNTAIGISPHTYTNNGAYTVTLTASNSGSCTATTTVLVNVTTFGCTLATTLTSTQGNNGLVNFSSVTTGTNGSTTYTLNYGDGNTSIGISPHTYTNNNTYTVTLSASNSGSCNAASTITLSISNVCTPTMNAGFSYSLNANGNVSFTSTSTNTSASTVYNWISYGPLPSTSAISVPGGQGASTTSVNYAANGSYVTQLTVYNLSTPTCSYTSSNSTITVNNICTLAAGFSYSPTINGNVNFANASTNTIAATVYTLNYGDGNASTTFTAHTYTANGSYTVLLTAYNNVSPFCASTYSTVVTVSNICSSTFSYTILSGGTVGFTATANPTSSLSSYTWNFGNGSNTITSANPSTLTTYTANGMYTVSLTYSNGNCSSSASNTLAIGGLTVPCNLSAGLTHTVSTGGFVSFASTATGTSSSTLYSWNFGDGFTSTGSSVSHSYTSNGAHTVMHTVTDGTNTSCSSTVYQSINITGVPCQANAGYVLTPSGTVHIYNATPAYPYNVIAATWNWGDGTSSNTLYASHTYSVASNYNICLTVIIACGDTANSCQSYTLTRVSAIDSPSDMIQVNVTAPGTIAQGIAVLSADKPDYSIYPNPGNGFFNLQMHSALCGPVRVTVYNLVGKAIYEDELSGNESLKTIDLSHAESGVYFIKAGSGHGTHIKKLVIAR